MKEMEDKNKQNDVSGESVHVYFVFQFLNSYISVYNPPKGVDHTFCMSKSAFVAGMMMLMRCHQLDLTLMSCHRVVKLHKGAFIGVAYFSMEEVLLYWSVDQYMLTLQS